MFYCEEMKRKGVEIGLEHMHVKRVHGFPGTSVHIGGSPLEALLVKGYWGADHDGGVVLGFGMWNAWGERSSAAGDKRGMMIWSL